MSVGYDLDGIQRPNVQWYLDAMADASAYLPAYVDIVARRYPAVRDIDIPARLSDTVTLSTMHGCPPDEIERISRVPARGARPAHLGEVQPDAAGRGAGAGHRQRRARATGTCRSPTRPSATTCGGTTPCPMFRRPAAGRGRARGLAFGLKLSNTLEVENWRSVFDRRPDDVPVGPGAPRGHREPGGDDRRGVRGRPAALVRRRRRLLQRGRPAGRAACAPSRSARTSSRRAATCACSSTSSTSRRPSTRSGAGPPTSSAGRSLAARLPRPTAPRRRARFNLRRYADRTRRDWRYRKASFRTDRSKTPRALGLFDCIAAPCVDECPVDQQVPHYMAAVRSGDFRRPRGSPAWTTRCRPSSAGSATTTARTPASARTSTSRWRSGRSSASSWSRSASRSSSRGRPATGSAGGDHRRRPGRAWRPREWLAHRGLRGHDLRGAPVPRRHGRRGHPGLPPAAGADRPGPRRPRAPRRRDPLRADGRASTSRSTTCAPTGSTRSSSPSAPSGRSGSASRARMPTGVIDALRFLRSVREGRPVPIGARVGVVGAGDTAMDCVRSALRVGAREASLIYRRTDRPDAGRPRGGRGLPRGGRAHRRARPADRRSTSRTAGSSGSSAPGRRYRGRPRRLGPADRPRRPGLRASRSRSTRSSWRSASTPCSTSSATQPPALTAAGFIDVDP